MRILIVKRDKLGDMLLTTPLIAHLRAALPKAQVCVLASDYCGWVVRGSQHIARLWTYPRLNLRSLLKPSDLVRFWRVFRDVREMRFDVAIAAGGEYSPRAVGKALAARAVRTISYAPPDHGFGPRLTDVMPPSHAGHEVDRVLALATPLGVPPPAAAPLPEYRPPHESQASAGSWLAQRGLIEGQFVVLGLGARRAARQPSIEQILAWSARWWQEHRLQTVLTWTPGKGSRLYPGDDELAKPVLAARRSDIHPFRGVLLDLLAVIWRARASVFPDSGLMHFAAASPGGVLGLFSAPKGPAQWGPRGLRARWLVGTPNVAALEESRVMRALLPLLGTPPSAGASSLRG
jgi:heptosyltransferase-3